MSGQSQGGDTPGDRGSGAAAGGRNVGKSSSAGLSDLGSAETAAATASSAGTRYTGGEGDPRGTPHEDLVGTTLLDRYAVTRQIGQGGMGAVYEATHTLIGKRVAVKVLLDKYARKGQVVARLEQEARLASSIGHEHIIDITDFGTTLDGRTFVVMEFLDGESLSELLGREGPLPEARILRIATQIASALGAAHAKGIIHRDVKPENVFVLRRNDRDFIKVVDFGISKSMRTSDTGEDESPRLTQTGMVLGTPLYMSPEQARGHDELDHRIDIYALGVIMYELATGHVPFSGSNYLAIISQVLNQPPPSPRAERPDLSEEFEAIILKSLAKDRDDRYASSAELLADLSALADDPTHSSQRARITGPRRHRLPRSRLRLAAWVAVIAVIVAGVVVTVTSTMGASRALVAAARKGPIDAAVPPVVAAAPVVKPSPPPARPEVVKVRIETQPGGATLYEGGRVVGTTPYDGEWPLASETVALVAELAGYDDAPCNIRPATDGGKTVTCKLEKVRKGQRRQIINKLRAHLRANGDGDLDKDPDGDGDLSGNPLLKRRR